MADREGFLFYRSFYEAIHSLPKKDRLCAYEAVIEYALNEVEPTLTGAPAAIFLLAKPNLDASRRKADSGKRGGQARSKTQANGKQTDSKSEAIKDKGLEIKDKGQETREYTGERADKPRPPSRSKHGQYGWVQLTDEEYSCLLNDLGETEVKRCIAYIDESAQATGNKNKWRDWNLVVRKCSREGWGASGRAQSGAKKSAESPKNYDSEVDFLGR